MYKYLPKWLLISVAKFVLEQIIKLLDKMSNEETAEKTAFINGALGGNRCIRPESLPVIAKAAKELIDIVKV